MYFAENVFLSERVCWAGLGWAWLCCAVLCSAVLCCAVLCCAVLCCAGCACVNFYNPLSAQHLTRPFGQNILIQQPSFLNTLQHLPWKIICFNWVTANSAFLPFVFQIRFTDRILRNPRNIKGSFDDFQSKRNRKPKVDNFFKLTDYKRIFLKVRSNYSKILRNTQNFSVNIVFFRIFFANTRFKFGSKCSFLLQMIVENHELFI